MIDLDKLEALAKAATPGPWETIPTCENIVRVPFDGARGLEGLSVADCRTDPVAAFIASANPATILALIERSRELEEREKENLKRHAPNYSFSQIEAERDLCDSLNISYPEWADNAAHKKAKEDDHD
jgi:hypothetical protein